MTDRSCVGDEARASRLSRLIATRWRGLLAKECGDHQAALDGFRTTLDGARELLPEWVGSGAWWLGWALLESGEPAEARPILQEAIDIYARRHEHGFLPMVQALAARAAAELGDLSAARALADGALGSALTYDVVARSYARWAAAEVSERMGRFAESRRLFEEAVAVLPPTYGSDIAELRAAFGRSLIRQRDLPAARRVLTAARDFYHDPVAFRKRAAVEALLRQCDQVRA